MITEQNCFGETFEQASESVAPVMNNNGEKADEIKRNILTGQNLESIINYQSPTEFLRRYSRLKKAMRKRSGGIF